jgi:uncharacterized protein YecE (DUF72 family)
MPILLPGCVLERVPNSKYAKLLRFTELCPRAPLPRPSTLRRWRAETPKELLFALRMPTDAVISQKGPLRLDDDLKTQIEQSVEAADALDAVAIRFETPTAITPSARSRDLLEAYSEHLPQTENRLRVWTYSGIWEAESAYAFAEKLGLACSFDPLAEPFPQGKAGYAYIKTLGTRVRLSTQTLRSVVINLTNASLEKVYIALDSMSAVQQAILLQRLVEETTPSVSLPGSESFH